jgi:hypothetical protein
MVWLDQQVAERKESKVGQWQLKNYQASISKRTLRFSATLTQALDGYRYVEDVRMDPDKGLITIRLNQSDRAGYQYVLSVIHADDRQDRFCINNAELIHTLKRLFPQLQKFSHRMQATWKARRHTLIIDTLTGR